MEPGDHWRRRTSAVGGATIGDIGHARSAGSDGVFSIIRSGFTLKVSGVPDIPSPPDPSKVLVHNLSSPTASTGVLELNQSTTGQVAQVFLTGSNYLDYTLESIEVGFGDAISSASVMSSLFATVWSLDLSGHPDTRQFALSKPAGIEAMETH